jgi:hypothetical protein
MLQVEVGGLRLVAEKSPYAAAVADAVLGSAFPDATAGLCVWFFSPDAAAAFGVAGTTAFLTLRSSRANPGKPGPSQTAASKGFNFRLRQPHGPRFLFIRTMFETRVLGMC